VLDELIERYGEGAVVSARPWVNDAGEADRWFIEIDGMEVSDIDLRIHPDSKRPGVMVMLLVYGGDEVEIDRWSTKKYKYGPAAVVRTLGDLGRKLR
jgi:hypothetical protein